MKLDSRVPPGPIEQKWDRFRRDLGNIEESYKEVMDRVLK